MNSRDEREYFVYTYIEEALSWSSTDDGTPLDQLDEVMRFASPEEVISPKLREDMQDDCAGFLDANATELTLASSRHGYPIERAGRDFWLARNRDGSCLWARGLGELGERLVAQARAYGRVCLHLGDDDLVHEIKDLPRRGVAYAPRPSTPTA
jgi:hypothetical protein